MFWRFGGYANISTIDTILDKADFTLEDLLDESDLIQELKQHNTKLIEYLREDKILEKLLEYVVVPKLEVFESPGDPQDEDGKGKGRLLPLSRSRSSSHATDTSDNNNDDDEEKEKKRNRYAFVSCEVLSSDTWSIYEALTANRQLIRDFWKFLERPSPLDPLQASYFTKVNESLFEKKTEEMMELLRDLPDVVSNLLKHVECPMVMDLLLKIIALDRNEGGQGIVEWLYSKDIIPTLLSCLGPERNWVVQTAAGDFIKAIITISANASQNDQQCIGPNELTRQLVSEACVEQLIGYMLGGGNALTVGVGIVIEVIRKNNSDYDPDVGTEANAVPSSRDPIYLGTLLRLFADNVPKFMSLIMDKPTGNAKLDSTFGQKLEPLGFDRFKTCELMAELLHCSNMGLLNEVGSEQLISTRDAERQRLRNEGKLAPLREEDPATDELTMRRSHGAPDENRRLEVTNADDDGFEEVESSKEMSEDTSHEFVKAEDDIPKTETLDKDDEDFVDEPLSSPRLAVAPGKVVEQQFEEPELVVAPLSPTKPKTSTLDVSPSSDVESGKAAGAESDVIHTTHLLASDPKALENESPKMGATFSTAFPPDTSNAQPKDTSMGESHPVSDTNDSALSPHPEDTPAPLFSSSAPKPKGSSQENQESQAEADATQPVDPSVVAAVEYTGEPSANLSAERTSETEVTQVEPVVGDYLKTQFVEHQVVPTILSFFFSYPWNNFLHNVVYDIVQQVFNGPMDRGYNPTLAVSLFEAADVTSAIINGQQVSDESHAKTRTRMGYMGHLTLIAEEVVKFTERHPPELLSETVLDKVMSQDWINYVEGALAETRERDNAILGGARPDIGLGQRGSIGNANGLGVGVSGLSTTYSGGSNALSDAGLNGGIELNESSGNGVGPFAISSGTLMSGFGSSSDEDDDDGDGDEEDINSEFRAYTEPLNAGSGGMDPPSIPPPPPPPPPLNVPPSRARRQLAARLAMHQKGGQLSDAFAASMANDENSDEDENENQDDPFADVDDVDDPDEDVGAEYGTERGAWWRSVVTRPAPGNDGAGSDDDDDGDEEFGDFAMAEPDKVHAEDEGTAGKAVENLVFRPLAVNPAKEGSSRGLSGLWPFASKPDEKEGEQTEQQKAKTELEQEARDDGKAVEVKEAKRRESIEDPDEDDEAQVVV